MKFGDRIQRERVVAGDPLMDSPRNLHDILDGVYRLQGVNINHKHPEVISRQMMRWIRVEGIDDSELLPEETLAESADK